MLVQLQLEETALAIEVAQRFNGEVSVGIANKVYLEGLDIGTGQGKSGGAGNCPHHLIDVRDVTESLLSAFDFVSGSKGSHRGYS